MSLTASNRKEKQASTQTSLSYQAVDNVWTPILQLENVNFILRNYVISNLGIREPRKARKCNNDLSLPNFKSMRPADAGLTSSSRGRHMAFARIGPLEDLKLFLDGLPIAKESQQNERLYPRDMLGTFAQQAAKRTARLLGFRQRPIDLQVSSWTPAMGDTLAILVSVPRPRGCIDELKFAFREKISKEPLIHVSYEGSDVPVFPTAKDASVWRALIPTTPLDKPGPRPLIVEVTDGRHKAFNGIVELCNKEYPVESIWLKKSKSNIRSTREEKEAVGAFTLTKTEEQIWCGPFLLPSEGEVTTSYGLQRFYNGIFAQGYYHRGVDYGADEGSPVRAPANGRVALVGKESNGFVIHGNCVGLDHGHGVTSMLMHLSAAWVQEGEMVRAGQVIGTVGETGLATGPHLHWGLHVHGKAVDPDPWMQEQPWV